MKVFLIDSEGASPWADDNHRLRFIANLCRDHFDVTEIVSGARQGQLPVLAPCGREADAAPLIKASAIVDQVKDEPPDLCIVPFRGGLAHGLLMARACGEMPGSMRIALIAESPTRSMILQHGEFGPSPMRAFVADAMERFCLQEADALLAAPDTDLAPLQALGPLPPLLRCLEPPLNRAALIQIGSGAKELCFIGPFSRAANVVTFIEVVESLASDDPGQIESVVFIGPISDAVHAPGKEWLGRRALHWPFAFRVIETDRLSDALDQICRSNCIAYFPDCPTGFADRLHDVGSAPVWLDATAVRDVDRLRAAITGIRRNARAVSRTRANANEGVDSFCDALDRIEPRRLRRAEPSVRCPPTLSFCILHKDRPSLLRQALDSVFAQLHLVDSRIELIVFDNGSVRQDSAELLVEIASDPRIELVRHSPALPNSTAMNAMARHASSDFLAFFDDDNLVAEGGVTALVRACATDAFDVITSNLWLFDADRPTCTRVAKLAFVGPAQTSGLFFNFFGDTCMAIRRSVFDRIGGFHDAKAAAPGADWILLARAQAAGASIGVLQEPAFHYRRNFDTADLSWQKYDQHEVRHLVLSHYGQAYDPELVAALAQHLVVEYYR